MGRLEFLLTAGIRLGREDLVAEAQLRGVKIVRRALSSGNFGLRHGTAFDNPGFHTGLSGIGYQLLRLANPQAFPSILLWD